MKNSELTCSRYCKYIFPLINAKSQFFFLNPGYIVNPHDPNFYNQHLCLQDQHLGFNTFLLFFTGSFLQLTFLILDWTVTTIPMHNHLEELFMLEERYTVQCVHWHWDLKKCFHPSQILVWRKNITLFRSNNWTKNYSILFH